MKGFEDKEAAARNQEAVTLLDDALKKGRIDASAKQHFEKFFELDHEAAKAALAALPERKPMETVHSESNNGDLTKMSWDELDKADLLYELKTKHPEVYKQKYNEKFNTKH